MVLLKVNFLLWILLVIEFRCNKVVFRFFLFIFGFNKIWWVLIWLLCFLINWIIWKLNLDFIILDILLGFCRLNVIFVYLGISLVLFIKLSLLLWWCEFLFFEYRCVKVEKVILLEVICFV